MVLGVVEGRVSDLDVVEVSLADSRAPWGTVGKVLLAYRAIQPMS